MARKTFAYLLFGIFVPLSMGLNLLVEWPSGYILSVGLLMAFFIIPVEKK